MHADFYAAVSAVMPILLLAFIWDSGYLRRLRAEQRTLRGRGGSGGERGDQTPGVLFWSKGRVRVYTLFVAFAVLCAIALAALVLADIVPDRAGIRTAISVALILELATLFFRIAVDVVGATRAAAPQSASQHPAPLAPRLAADGPTRPE